METTGTLFGYAVNSVFSHARLSEAAAQRGTLEIARCDPVDPGEGHVTHRHARAGGESLTIARIGEGELVVTCSGVGGFRLAAADARLLADRISGSDELWEHRLVTVAVPLLLAEKGDIALHAAAIEHAGWAVAFAGASTRGKSTLALAGVRAGFGVLADDGVVLERRDDDAALVWPGPSSIRVARPGREFKETIPVQPSPLAPVRLAAVVVLGPLTDDGPLLDRIEPVRAVPALVPALIFSGSDRLGQAMRDAAWLAANVPVLRCRMPIGVERLPAALVEVLDRVVSGAAG